MTVEDVYGATGMRRGDGMGVTLLIFPTQTKRPGMKYLPLQLAACFLWAFL